MKQLPPKIENMQIVSEEIVRWCAEQMTQLSENSDLEIEENSFIKCLEVADELREAGLTPIFLCTHSFRHLTVTSKEKLQKKFH
jgi:hypothetical protein